MHTSIKKGEVQQNIMILIDKSLTCVKKACCQALEKELRGKAKT